ncbi:MULTISPECIES: enolase C-terminal domain-like protein [Streptomyces]|uniref:enolase C-terminal domain-like protein n=1 Tax=Streptomyces lycopersici TaxID=2974589 RepID=UPI0021D343C6|nr:enolase C-terminal domain-like protein [Streptomyces sp. NEAU-383]
MKASQRTVRLELAEPLRISRSTMAARDAVWLTVEHAGQYGHGEAVTSGYYGLDTATLQRLLHQASRDLVHHTDPESALSALREEQPGHRPGAVRAAVESALLDLCGKRAGLALHRLLDPSSPLPFATTARTVGIVPAERAAVRARCLADSGFSVIKVKAGSQDPEDDVARVRAVRAAAPAARLLLDPNGAWTVARARELLPRFAEPEAAVEAVEQPIAPGDPEALARLAERSPLPVIADEDAVDHEDVRRLAGRVQGVNVKLAKCGGVHAALRIASLLEGSGTDLMLGCLTASTLGLAPAVHLADRARWIDLDGHLLLAHDPWTGIGGADGVVRTSGRPGLGVRRRTTAEEAGGAKGNEGIEGGERREDVA